MSAGLASLGHRARAARPPRGRPAGRHVRPRSSTTARASGRETCPPAQLGPARGRRVGRHVRHLAQLDHRGGRRADMFVGCRLERAASVIGLTAYAARASQSHGRRAGRRWRHVRRPRAARPPRAGVGPGDMFAGLAQLGLRAGGRSRASARASSCSSRGPQAGGHVSRPDARASVIVLTARASGRETCSLASRPPRARASGRETCPATSRSLDHRAGRRAGRHVRRPRPRRVRRPRIARPPRERAHRRRAARRVRGLALLGRRASVIGLTARASGRETCPPASRSSITAGRRARAARSPRERHRAHRAGVGPGDMYAGRA